MVKKKTHELKLVLSPWWMGGLVVVIVMIAYVMGSGKILSLGSKVFVSPSPTLVPSPTVAIFVPGADTDMLPKEQYADMAVKDLAQKKEVPIENISVVTTVPKKWGDTSLGCPEKGRMYSQIILSGFEIILSLEGNTYTYHAGGGNVVQCGMR